MIAEWFCRSCRYAGCTFVPDNSGPVEFGKRISEDHISNSPSCIGQTFKIRGPVDTDAEWKMETEKL